VVFSCRLSVIGNRVNKMQDYKNLQIWKDAYNITLGIYGLSRKFPQSEAYNLTQQIRRSAHSINSNIAEGAGRKTNPDFLRFLYNASGSLAETKNHLQLARDLNHITNDEYFLFNKKLDILGRMLNTFMKKLTTEN